MIFLTDGEDNKSSSYTYDEIINIASNDKIIIYTIGVGNVSQSTLEKIASQTGGKYYYASNASGLNDIFDNIESNTIDMTTDSNNDGITDYYTNLMNSGKLCLSNGTPIFAGVLDMFSSADADWDKDGLKNGEEIEIKAKSDGTVYIHMKSNPLLWDSDFDGYNDYVEVKTMHTDPLKFTSDGADKIKQLQNDNTFPAEYLDFSKQDHGLILFLFGWKRNEWAKHEIIDYFYKYRTSDEELSANEYSHGVYNFFSTMANINEAAASVVGALNAVQGLYADASQLNPAIQAETEVQESLLRLEKADSTSETERLALTSARKYDLDNLNRWSKQNADGTFKIDNIANERFKTAEWLSDKADFANTFKDIITETEGALSGITKFAQGTAFTATAAKIILNIKPVHNLAVKAAGKINLPVPSSKALILTSDLSVAETARKIGYGFTIVVDVFNTAKDFWGVFATYSQVADNYAEFVKYVDLL